METTTETDSNDRELTPFEIKISIAQIEDRLIRVAKAQTEFSRIDGENAMIKLAEKLRKKYQIPEQVHLFHEGMSAALSEADVKICKPYITAFVKGKLTDDGMNNLIFFFEENAECDYGWIRLEWAIGFYNQSKTDDMEKIIAEIRSIGTRSRAKAKNLPKLTNCQ